VIITLCHLCSSDGVTNALNCTGSWAEFMF